MEGYGTNAFFNMKDFWTRNKEWILKYEEKATNFDTEMVERIMYDELNGKLQDCSVLILTASQVEQNILTRKLYEESNKDKENKSRMEEICIGKYVYQFARISNINIVHLHPHTQSSFTEGGAANAVRDALERFRPKLVVSLGVSFGINPKEQYLGDVIISQKIIPYDIYNKDVDGDIKLRAEDTCYTHEAINAWDVLMRSKNFSLEKEESKRRSLIGEKLEFRWQYGALLSGGSVLSNEEKISKLVTAAKKIGQENVIGGDMEGSGIYSECKKANIPCVVIKGICDWAAEKNAWDKIIECVHICGDEKKHITNDSVKDSVQGYAMDNAVEAFWRLIRFDSNFLESYYVINNNIVPDKLKNAKILRKMRKMIQLNEKKIIHIIKRIFLWLLFLCFINVCVYCYGVVNRVEIPKCIYWIEVICMIISIVISELSMIYPMEVRNRWINFSIFKEDYRGYFFKVLLNDSRPIFNVTVFCWMKSGKVKESFKEVGNLKKHDLINVELPEAFNYKTILQIDYELANGERYVHLISGKWYQKFRICRKQKVIIYSEKIYRREGSKTELIEIQNGTFGKCVNTER